MSIASGYTLEVQCDKCISLGIYAYANGEFIDDSNRCKAACYAEARQFGWRLNREKAYCPIHSGSALQPWVFKLILDNYMLGMKQPNGHINSDEGLKATAYEMGQKKLPLKIKDTTQGRASVRAVNKK